MKASLFQPCTHIFGFEESQSLSGVLSRPAHLFLRHEPEEDKTVHSITSSLSSIIFPSFVHFSTFPKYHHQQQQQQPSFTMPSPSSSSSCRQELLSTLAGAASLTNSTSAASASFLEDQEGRSPDTNSATAQYHYETLKDEPSTKKILQPSRRARRTTSSSRNPQDGSGECCFPAPRQSELDVFAFAEDILHKVQQEVQIEAESDQQHLRQEGNRHSSRRCRRLRRRSSELRHDEIL